MHRLYPAYSRFQTNLVRVFVVLVVVGALVQPLMARATSSITFIPEVPLPGLFDKQVDVDSSLLAQYIRAVFIYFIWIVGTIATFMIIYGGIRWVAAAGNPGQIKDARDILDNAVIGVIIALASVVLLNIINPKLTELSMPNTGQLQKQLTGLVGATHPCTSTEITKIVAQDSTGSACGKIHQLTNRITVDSATGLPASSGKEAYDACITTGCDLHSEVCLLDKDTTNKVFASGACGTSVPLVHQTNSRYQSLTTLTIQNSKNVSSPANCGFLVGTSGGVVGNQCLGTLGNCYVTSTPVSIISQTTSDRATNFTCPSS